MRTERQLIAPPPAKPNRSRARNLFAAAWFTFFALLAAWNFVGTSSPPVTKNVAASPMIAANAATPPALFQIAAEAKPKFAAKPIRDIFPIADRVIAKNPEAQPDELVDLSEAELAELETEPTELLDNEPLPALIDGIPDDAELLVSNDDEEEDDSGDVEPTSAEKLYEQLFAAAEAFASQTSDLGPEFTDYGPFVREHWRVIHFLLTRPDGDLVRIWLARPTWWLEQERVAVDGKYDFDMEEVGAVGIADVVSIDECQQPPRRQNEHHRLVTGKFVHEATNVIELYIEGQVDPIGTTANHPFWSEDRHAFVEAESLRPGENLKTAADEFLRVINYAPRPGPHTVYNLEIDGEHVYYVEENGILVHNAYADKFRTRSVAAVAVLRAVFNGSARAKFLKHLASQPGAVAKYGARAVARMKKGLVPKGMVVHHRTPLFRGGSNLFNNLALIKRTLHNKFFSKLHYYPKGAKPPKLGGL